jgi:hypothetical protein
MGEWRYSSTTLDLGNTQLSGELEASVALPQGTPPPVPTVRVGPIVGLGAEEKDLTPVRN